MNETKEMLKTLLRKAINNAKEDTVDGKKGRWITVKGTHVFIPDGENQEEVVKKFLEDKGSKSETKDEQGSGKKEKSEPEWLQREKQKLDRQTTQMYEDRETIKKDDNYKREADIALTMMAQDYEKRGNKGTADRANEIKEKLKKGEELTEKDKADIKTALDTYKPKDKGSEGKKGYSLSKEYKNHVQFEGDKESGGYPRKIHKDLESAKKFYEYKKEGQEGAEKQNLKEKGKRGIPVRDYPVIVKNPLGDGFIVATHGLAQKHDLKEVYPVNREENVKNGLSEIIKNCEPKTKQDLEILKGLEDILSDEE